MTWTQLRADLRANGCDASLWPVVALYGLCCVYALIAAVMP